MDFNVAKNRAEELTKILNDCIDKYYVGNESDVSDYDYDMMMRELSSIEEEFPQLLKEDSPTHRVGGSSDTTFEKVTHTVRMESLQDAFSVDELKDFAECGLCGTAAVISPVGKIVNHGEEICFPSGMTEMGPVTKKLYDTLTGIQMGRIEAPEGWIKVIK